jgi:siroheme synthase-like protein
MFVDLSDRLVVIIGGGTVAVRKAQGLLAAGATMVQCVAIHFHADMPSGVQRIAEAFEPRHLDGAWLVFAATDVPAVNEQVVREAHRRNLLVNRADADEERPGDFVTPAIWRSEAVLVGVSAGGSPALAAAMRDDVAKKMDPRHVHMAAVMQELRPIIRANVADIARRREIFRELAGAAAMDMLHEGGVATVRRWLAGRYPELGPRLD